MKMTKIKCAALRTLAGKSCHSFQLCGISMWETGGHKSGIPGGENLVSMGKFQVDIDFWSNKKECHKMLIQNRLVFRTFSNTSFLVVEPRPCSLFSLQYQVLKVLNNNNIKLTCYNIFPYI